MDKAMTFSITLVNPWGHTLTTSEKGTTENEARTKAYERINADPDHKRYGSWITFGSTRES